MEGFSFSANCMHRKCPYLSKQFASTESGDLPEWAYDFEAGGNIEINDEIGSGWYLDTQAGDFGYGVAGDDNRVYFL